MLDYDAGRTVKPRHAFQCRVGVGKIIVGKRLPLQLAGRGQRAGGGFRFRIEGRGLVGVLAVPQFFGEGELHGIGMRVIPAVALVVRGAEVIGHVGVVVCRV